jgi:hypothetical protein
MDSRMRDPQEVIAAGREALHEPRAALQAVIDSMRRGGNGSY